MRCHKPNPPAGRRPGQTLLTQYFFLLRLSRAVLFVVYVSARLRPSAATMK